MWRGLKIVALEIDIAVLSTCWVRHYCYETINFHNFIEKENNNFMNTSQLNKVPMNSKQMQENPSTKVSVALPVWW